MRSKLRSATDEPPRDVLTPPPNMSDSPLPLPLCSRTNSISNRLTLIRTISNRAIMNVLLDPKLVDRIARAEPVTRYAGGWSRYRTIATNSSGSRLAPPTRAPSTSG